MTDKTAVLLRLLLCLMGMAGSDFCAAADEAVARESAAIFVKSNITGGFVLHLGAGDGRLTAALRRHQGVTVQGLEMDVRKVHNAREAIQKSGLYGPVSIARFQGGRLPYMDNLFNLVVVDDVAMTTEREVLRVLAPEGAACFRQGNPWRILVKPRPEGIDAWTHFLHDAGNNAVAEDTAVGPPRTVQWIADPLWLRSHETPSGVQALVSSGKRIFYIFDEGLIGITDERLPDRWSIVCRDAFNGKLLWKRPLKSWGWREWAESKWKDKDWTVVRAGRVAVPEENQRCLVAAHDRLYTVSGFKGSLEILDAGTGELVKAVAGTEGTGGILASGGLVVVRCQAPVSDMEKRRGKKPAQATVLKAVNGKTGSEVWTKRTNGIMGQLMAADQGRLFYREGVNLVCLDLVNGKEIWRKKPQIKRGTTLVATQQVVLLKDGTFLACYRAADGHRLWRQKVNKDSGAGSVDLFVAAGLVWTGMWSVDAQGKRANRTARMMSIGYDVLTGEEKKQIVADNLRSCEHHHRCFRNKATARYMISAMEGAEFMDLTENGHSQNNWLRGACKLGVMPANGLLYVPPDQCFCHPGSKLLGFAALGPERKAAPPEIPDVQRLQKGPAYGQVPVVDALDKGDEGWPTFRHDPRRSGSTPMAMPARLEKAWEKTMGGRLTPAVSAHGRLFVADIDAHTLYALEGSTGRTLWRFTAGGRIDSPPTVHQGVVLFGAHDGRVYCLRETDGHVVWTFTAAPADLQMATFDQVASVWPVHGSVLIYRGTAYVAAGRSTYLDGGIRLYGLNPLTGQIRHKGLLEGPHPVDKDKRDYSFYTMGANSDVLVAEGGKIFMRQKELTPALKEVKNAVLSSKGEKNMGLHVFSTAGLLDGSWYNRTFWMYAKRWPGFQLANQAPKSGQLLVMDGHHTFGVKVFYRRNTHSPMFFPGREGYLVFADKNSTEPQIVGEAGARKPLAWLPQSDYSRGRDNQIRKLDSPAFGQDKMMGYTRADPPVWKSWLPIRVRAMVKTRAALLVAGPPDVYDPKDPFSTFEGRKGARLAVLASDTGDQKFTLDLTAPPVFDGMIAASGCVVLSLTDGRVVCFRDKE